MEQFKRIAAYPDYDVNTSGVVRSWKSGAPVILHQTPSKQGYLTVHLRCNGKEKTFKVHRLVAEAFIPNLDNKPQVNHINGIKTDNRVENLEWVTNAENQKHAYDTGLSHQGEEHGRAKLTNEQVIYIRDNPDNLTGRALAAMFDVTATAISNIRRGKSYKIAGGTVRDKFGVPADVRAEIRQLYAQGGISKRAIAKKFGISHPTVSRIVDDLAPKYLRRLVSAEDRAEIRRLFAQGGINQRALAKKFGIGATTVSRIVKDLPPENKWRLIPDNIRDEIRRLYAQGGVSQRALAKKFGISSLTVFKIIHENNEFM